MYLEYTFIVLVCFMVLLMVFSVYRYFANKKPTKSNYAMRDWILLGPLLPLLKSHNEKHGGFSKREIIGWVVVFILMLIGIIVGVLEKQ